MKKNLLRCGIGFLLILWMMFVFGVSAFAEETTTVAKATAEAFADEIYGELHSDAAELLDELGLSDFSMDSVLSLSARNVIDTLLNIFRGSYRAPLRAVVLLCAVSVLGALATAFFAQDSKIQTAFDMCSALIVTCILANSLTTALQAAFSAVKLCSDFMLTYIPGFSGIIAMSGKPLTSAAYSSGMVAVSNLYAQVGVHYFQPLLLVYLCFSIFAALQEKYTLQPITQCLKKGIYLVFGFAATVFSGLLTVKGALATSGDSVTVKGVKMLVGSTVPIVGSALSEGVTSVLASAELIKSTVGIFGILVIACTVLPSVMQLFLWYFALSFGGAVADALGQSRIKNILQGISGVLSVANVFLIFTAYVFIVSTGIILQFRGS